MKLEDIISKLDKIDDELVIYQHAELGIDSPISLFDSEATGGRTRFTKDEMEYHYLLEIFLVNEFVEGWISNLGKRPTDKEIAKRVFEYAINDA